MQKSVQHHLKCFASLRKKNKQKAVSKNSSGAHFSVSLCTEFWWFIFFFFFFYWREWWSSHQGLLGFSFSSSYQLYIYIYIYICVCVCISILTYVILSILCYPQLGFDCFCLGSRIFLCLGVGAAQWPKSSCFSKGMFFTSFTFWGF